MSPLFYQRALTAALYASAICFGCSSDQKTPNTPDTARAPESPAGPSMPQPGDPADPTPNGEPTAMPPDAPPPQSLNPAAQSGNAVAMTKPSTSPAPTPQLSESQIAMVTQLANSSEIEQAKLAQGKAKAASVKKFAAMMIKHHSEAKTEQSKLFRQLNLTPTESQTATALKADADKTLTDLRTSTAGSFDELYIDSQVEAHQKVLDALNNELLPAATDTELISGLNKMKATVESHLHEAKSIQAELAKSNVAH